MKITDVTCELCDLPVEKPRSDAIQAFQSQETVLVDITTDAGIVGRGYSYTIGTGGSAILNLLRSDLSDLLIGEEALGVEALWSKLFWATHATTVGPITSCALAAVDIALWDIRCKSFEQPLWVVAGGAGKRPLLYDTEGGWLNYSLDELVHESRASVAKGWSGIKVKVGKTDAREDLDRLQAVREAVGPHTRIMIDANQAFTCAEAKRRARLFEDVDVYWFEEPLPADDVGGHARLAASTSIPIAVGESLYSLSQFREYFAAGAAGIAQPDVARIGGITPWLKVAHLAEAFNIDVAPHYLMELHVSLVAAIPNGMYVEYIPQLRAIMTAEMGITDGRAELSLEPGIGIDWNPEAIAALRVEQ